MARHEILEYLYRQEPDGIVGLIRMIEVQQHVLRIGVMTSLRNLGLRMRSMSRMRLMSWNGQEFFL